MDGTSPAFLRSEQREHGDEAQNRRWSVTDPLLAPAEALGLAVAPTWEEAVLFHLRILLQLGGEGATAVADMPDVLDPLPLDRPPETP